jgi:prepilin-type processing-associated H-X9-DG protein
VPEDPLAFTDDPSDGWSKRDPFGANGWPGAVGANDVTAAMFLLIRTQDITSEVFVCPSSNGEKDTYGTAPGASAQNKTAFSKWRGNMTYGLANPYPSVEAVNLGYRWNSTLGAEFAVAADRNPGVVNGCDVTAVTETSPMSQMAKANSPNHQGAGENVLYADGHVEFVQNPFSGTKRDNIYTVSGSTDGNVSTSKVVVGSPRWAGDSVILPAQD